VTPGNLVTTMRPRWLSSLNGCLQMIVRSGDDVEVEAGDVKVGELRARAFEDLRRSLDDRQLLSLAWFTLADLACWPQLPATEVNAMIQVLESGAAFMRPVTTIGEKDTTSARAMQLLPALLGVIHAAARRVADPQRMPAAEVTAIRTSVNTLAREHGKPIEYWEKWLRRVVPAAATLAPDAARALTLAAIRATLPLTGNWEYAASSSAGTHVLLPGQEVRVAAVTPRLGGRTILELGSFTDTEPVNRRIEAKLAPAVPVDPYRMGYLFRSSYMTDLLDDAKTGHYDAVKCTNTATGETWAYSSL